jgi:hypothetical protein
VIPVGSEAEFHAEHDGVYRFSSFSVWDGDIAHTDEQKRCDKEIGQISTFHIL